MGAGLRGYLAGMAEPGAGRAGAPEAPTRLRPRSWWAVLKRSVREFQDDNLMDWAAALTYYAVLSLFPALIVLVAILGLAGQHPETSDALLDIVDQLGPSSAVENFRSAIESVVRSNASAGALLSVGLLGAVWSASGYIGAFIRAANAIYEIEEGRPFWKRRPLQVVITVAMVLLLAVVSISLVVTGPVAEAIGNVIGVGDTAVSVWNVAKWPVLVAIVMGMFAFLYYIAPNVRQPRFRWITPGGVVAVLAWIVASAGFAFYVANFGSYNKTYGALAGVVVFLLWLWISNLALLFGAEFDAELERQREIDAGVPGAEREIQLPPREEPE
jgi:membrane protein